MIDNWFMEHDTPPKSSSKSGDMNDIQYLWYRLITTQDRYD